MSIELRCERCGRLLRVPDDSEGKQARCPACRHTFRIASQSSAQFEGHSHRAPTQAENAATDSYRETEPENPYQSPTHPQTYVEIAKPFGQYVLASRVTRLAGVILDGLIRVVAMIPGFILILAVPGEPVFAVLGAVLLLGLLLTVGVVNWVMIANSGQSIAKRMLSMRIVGASDGLLPGFMRGVVIRNWLPMFINQVCALFGPINALWIFGEEKRCLHDLMADTIVIEVRPDEVSYDAGRRPH